MTLVWNFHDIVGVPHYSSYGIRRDWTVPHVMPAGHALSMHGEPVLASGYLIIALEDATWRAVLQHVPGHLTLAGRDGNYHHVSPALAGQNLDVVVTCTGGHITRSGSRTWWQTSAHVHTTGRLVGVLEHTLAVTDSELFHKRLVEAL